MLGLITARAVHSVCHFDSSYSPSNHLTTRPIIKSQHPVRGIPEQGGNNCAGGMSI
jgi:hypothetical protein